MTSIKWGFRNDNRELFSKIEEQGIKPIFANDNNSIGIEFFQNEGKFRVIIQFDSKGKTSGTSKVKYDKSVLSSYNFRDITTWASLKEFSSPKELTEFLNSLFPNEDATSLKTDYRLFLATIISRSLIQDGSKIIHLIDNLMDSSDFQRKFQALQKIYS